MNLPNLPTDNLYKFQFISGVAILIAVFLYSFTTISTLENQINNLEQEMSITKLSSEFIFKDSDNLVNLLNGIDKIKKTANIEDIPNIEKIESQITSKLDDLKTKSRSIQIKDIEIQYQSNLKSKIQDTKDVFNFGTLIGLILSVLGYWNWYSRLQKYEDIIIKGRAEEYLKEQKKRRTIKQGL